MKKLIFTILTVLLFSNIVFAQYLDYHTVTLMEYVRINHETSEQEPTILTGASIKGSPYLNDEFIKGTVYTTSKNKIADIELRYNIYNDDLEFKTPDDLTLAVNEPETIKLADFGDYKMTYKSYTNGKKTNSAFFKILEEGKVSLFAKPDVFFQKEVEGDGIKPGKPAQFVQKSDNYYISIGENTATKVGSKKDILNLMEDHSKEISAYLKQNKVKLSKSEQLQQLVQYYNSL